VRGFEDAANDLAIYTNDIVIVGTIGPCSTLVGPAQHQIPHARSSSASRFNAGACGFLNLSQSGDVPDREREPCGLDTIFS
jgi:hypothetical protein